MYTHNPKVEKNSQWKLFICLHFVYLEIVLDNTVAKQSVVRVCECGFIYVVAKQAVMHTMAEHAKL